jgi:hypothetical protein
MLTFATPFFYIGLGSGIQDPGSGIRDPGSEIRDPGSEIRDPGSEIRDLGSGMNKYSDPDPGSGIKHPGFATLVRTQVSDGILSVSFAAIESHMKYFLKVLQLGHNI